MLISATLDKVNNLRQAFAANGQGVFSRR